MNLILEYQIMFILIDGTAGLTHALHELIIVRSSSPFTPIPSILQSISTCKDGDDRVLAW
jgi:hypothetical protein